MRLFATHRAARVASSVLFALLLAACASRSAEVPASPNAAAAEPAPLSESAQAPLTTQLAHDFELETTSGDRVQLSELQGKGRTVLLDFWASWCEPCKMELPHLDSLQRRYGDRGLTVLAISVDAASDVGEVRTYVRSHGLRLAVPLDADRRVTDQFNPKMILPFWVLIDRSGKVVRTHQGYLPGDETELEEAVKSVVVLGDRTGSS